MMHFENYVLRTAPINTIGIEVLKTSSYSLTVACLALTT